MSQRKGPSEPVVAILGSTGTGKSDLAVELACRFNGEIINADAMQMYKGLPIITNKIPTEEQRGIPHHLLGMIRHEEEPWHVGDFKKEASRLMREIRSRGKLPIIVGGTHYYIDGLLFENHLVDGDLQTPSDDTVGNGNAAYPIMDAPTDVILAKLREVDPVMADKWHPNDRRKIKRSLEIFLATGRRASDIYAEQERAKQSKAESRAADSPWQTLLLWAYSEPDVLNERLDKRVDKMMDDGLVEETQEINGYLQDRLRNGIVMARDKGIWQSIGFKEMESYLCGLQQGVARRKLEKLKEAGLVEMKAATRRYAKYQVRWITSKTIPLIKDNNALDHLFLLDATDAGRWSQDVTQTATSLARLFLKGKELPPPSDVSETARKVLASTIEQSSAVRGTPCRKTCEACDVTILTEELWQKHIEGKRHRRVARSRKKPTLVAAEPAQDKPELPRKTSDESRAQTDAARLDAGDPAS